MAYNDRKKGKESHNLEKHLRIEQPLSSDRQPIKIGDEVSGLLLKDKDVIVENDLIVGGDISGVDDLTVGDDLTVVGLTTAKDQFRTTNGVAGALDGTYSLLGKQVIGSNSNLVLYNVADIDDYFLLLLEDLGLHLSRQMIQHLMGLTCDLR